VVGQEVNCQKRGKDGEKRSPSHPEGHITLDGKSPTLSTIPMSLILEARDIVV